jgi:hypothetical protein
VTGAGLSHHRIRRALPCFLARSLQLFSVNVDASWAAFAAGWRVANLSIILDASTTDAPATVGFDSLNCDEDFRRPCSPEVESLLRSPRTARGASGARISKVQGR